MLEKIKGYKKLDFDQMSTETFEKKQYFSELTLEMVRLKFKISSKVVPTIRNNFKRKYKDSSFSCPSCRNLDSQVSNHVEDSQSHVMLYCPAFVELRENKDLSNDRDLTEFFKAVIEY